MSKNVIITRDIQATDPILSILILTIPNRKEKFNRLISELHRQAAGFPNQVEVISVYDNKTVRIGKKRQMAIEVATGQYIKFIDDDDFIYGGYLMEVIPELQKNPDCIGFKFKCEFRDINGRMEEVSNAIMSNRFDDWYHEGYETINGEIFRYRQMIYHKSPIKSEYVKEVGFKDMASGEDYDFAKRIKPYLKNFQTEPGQRYAR